MVDRGPTRGVGTVNGVVALDNGVGDVFDQIQVVDRSRSAVLVGAFEGVVKHRRVVGDSSRVDVLISGGFRRGMRGGGLPGNGPVALGIFAGVRGV